MQLLQHSNLRDVLHHFTVNGALGETGDDEDDDADANPRWLRRRRRPRPDPNRFPKIPSAEGMELMNSGTFGSNEAQTVSSGDRNGIGKKKKLARRILDRELATESYAKQKVNQRLMAQVRMATDASRSSSDCFIGNDTFLECRYDHSL
jgi:DDB1- and CUL4-associated factor 11